MWFCFSCWKRRPCEFLTELTWRQAMRKGRAQNLRERDAVEQPQVKSTKAASGTGQNDRCHRQPKERRADRFSEGMCSDDSGCDWSHCFRRKSRRTRRQSTALQAHAGRAVRLRGSSEKLRPDIAVQALSFLGRGSTVGGDCGRADSRTEIFDLTRSLLETILLLEKSRSGTA